ncbi:uncharacterized protein LOC129224060 isoform X2 [Uloborus diversus]|uniref:uncharacterized protein LOC129224060 isoform X2 n=1 Tax=Uloborus diversus TaxID=327109 RepID=UPI002409363D|nr:uncharacterized protein LOC129224060 isoform X2 [Uloborus diversus]
MEDDDTQSGGYDEFSLVKGKSHLTITISANLAPYDSGPFQKWVMKIHSWEVKEGFHPNSDSITLIQRENEEIRNTWNYKFKIELTIMLLNETQLKLDAVITNTGSEKFSFSCSFYSYFIVSDVLDDKISGLNGCTYIHKEEGGNDLEKTREQCLETNKKIKLSELSHRIYINTPSGQKIEKLPSNRTVKLEKFNLPDIVLYNPYGEGLSGLDGDEIETGYNDCEKENTICIEAGTVDGSVALEPNKSYAAHLILTVE